MQDWLDARTLDRYFPKYPRRLFLDFLRRARLSPMCGLLRDFSRRGFVLKDARTLEMFGGTGNLHTVDYASRVSSLEVWEIDPVLAPELQRNLPGATVRITDSFVQLRSTKDRFDLIFVDPPYAIFDGHCEHFDLFPEIFRILNKFAVLVLCNVRPKIVMTWRYTEQHFARRKAFYGVEDPQTVAVEQMLSTYEHLAMRNGFTIKWWILRDRSIMYRFRGKYLDRVCYLALALQRNTDH